MTRVNLIPAKMLLDQHLTGELHEISRVGTLARRAWVRDIDRNNIPKRYKRGEGHVTFFYDKGGFVIERIKEIQAECLARGVTLTVDPQLYIDTWLTMPKSWLADWKPKRKDMKVSVEWVQEKVAEKPFWYKMKGVNLTEESYQRWLRKTNKLCRE